MKVRKLNYCIFLLLVMQLIFLWGVVQDELSLDERSFKDMPIRVKPLHYSSVTFSEVLPLVCDRIGTLDKLKTIDLSENKLVTFPLGLSDYITCNSKSKEQPLDRIAFF